MPEFFLVLGMIMFAMGFRSIRHPIAHRVGSCFILAASYFAGYFISGYWQVGVAGALSWFFLPWLEILTRLRRLRLPNVNQLHGRRPPNREEFPALEVLTDQFEEEEGFERADDIGWDWQNHTQFLRVFTKKEESLQAVICYVEQEGFAFYYLSIFSRTADERCWVTWNFPFSHSMAVPPEMVINRLKAECTVMELLVAHRQWIAEAKVGAWVTPDPERVREDFERDFEQQVCHNVRCGILRNEPDGSLAYTWRGYFFVWLQFLKDLVR